MTGADPPASRPATRGPVVTVEHLEKRFRVRDGRHRRWVDAVSDLSFEIGSGEFVGYIGPNGAGKSTTIKVLTGILTPSGGQVQVAGLVPSRQRVDLARRIGVVFGQRTTLWWDLPLRESFELVRRMYRIDPERFRSNLDSFVEMLELGPLLPVPVRQLSLGQRMRGDLTAAFLHDPPLVFLDEPTVGLDVVSRARIRTFLAGVNADRGTTVLLTTHDLRDIERLCRRVMVIDQGQLLHDGPLSSIVERFGTERVLVVDLVEATEQPIDITGARVQRIEGPRQHLAFDRRRITAAALVGQVMERYRVQDLAVQEPDIEDIVARLTAGSSRSDGGPPAPGGDAGDGRGSPTRSPAPRPR